MKNYLKQPEGGGGLKGDIQSEHIYNYILVLTNEYDNSMFKIS